MAADGPFAILPPELVQGIVAYLDKDDLSAVRLTCAAFSHLGLAELFREVKLTQRLSSFERLRAMSQQPHLVRHVRSIYYQADVLPSIREHVTWWMQDQQASPSFPAATEAYYALYNEQRRIRREQVDSFCLSRLLTRCRHLDIITIAFGGDDPIVGMGRDELWCPPIVPDAEQFVEECTSDRSRRPEALEMVADAVRTSGLAPPPKLRVLGINVEGDELELAPATRQRINDYLQRLTEIEIRLTDAYIEDSHSDIDGTLHNQRLISGAAPNVQVLTISYPPKEEPWEDSVRFHRALDPSLEWRKLEHLTVAYAAIYSVFCDVVCQRMPALKRLSLVQLHLEGETVSAEHEGWENVFERLSARTPKLQHAQLSGWFSDGNREQTEIDFSAETSRSVKLAVESFITKGGSCPDLSGYIAHLNAAPDPCDREQVP